MIKLTRLKMVFFAKTNQMIIKTLHDMFFKIENKDHFERCNISTGKLAQQELNKSFQVHRIMVFNFKFECGKLPSCFDFNVRSFSVQAVLMIGMTCAYSNRYFPKINTTNYICFSKCFWPSCHRPGIVDSQHHQSYHYPVPQQIP